MYDGALLMEKLEQIDEALAKVERRFASIDSPDDFWIVIAGWTCRMESR